jgi:hypothetical protein
MSKILKLLNLWKWRSLWTSEKHEWFLVRMPGRPAHCQNYGIHRSDGSILLVEDDELYILLKEQMFKAGNLIVDLDVLVKR